MSGEIDESARPSRTHGLACPVCGEGLADGGASAACGRGHSFDFARSGYLNLTRSGDPARIGDTAAMVRARSDFLAAGHLAPLAEAIAARVNAAAPAPGFVVEIGSGTGYYLDAIDARLRGRTPPALGIDLSKAAAEHAARRFPELALVVADAQARLPLLDANADAAVSVFAPRPAPELARVTRPGGALVVAFAAPRHLAALRAALGLLDVHADKLVTLRERLGEWFEPAGQETVETLEYPVELSRADAEAAVLMGPNAHHGVDLAPLAERTADLVSVTVAEFRRTNSPAPSQ